MSLKEGRKEERKKERKKERKTEEWNENLQLHRYKFQCITN